MTESAENKIERVAWDLKDGEAATGVINLYMWKKKWGFISQTGAKDSPSIFFHRDDWKTRKIRPNSGLAVKFTAQLVDGKMKATKVSLTEEGIQKATEIANERAVKRGAAAVAESDQDAAAVAVAVAGVNRDDGKSHRQKKQESIKKEIKPKNPKDKNRAEVQKIINEDGVLDVASVTATLIGDFPDAKATSCVVNFPLSGRNHTLRHLKSKICTRLGLKANNLLMYAATPSNTAGAVLNLSDMDGLVAGEPFSVIIAEAKE